MDFKDEIKQTFQKHNISLSNEQVEKFEKYYLLLTSWNEKINLTTITSQTDVIEKHFLDSAIAYDLICDGKTLLDIGAGPGFPSIPLKIMLPNLKITLVDSVNKKVNFLNTVIEELSLQDAKAIHFRAEDLAVKNEYRENFDYCVSRAVASLNTLAEYCLPFVKKGGTFLAYKSSNIEEELDTAKKAIKILGGKTKEVFSKKINDLERTFVSIYKIETTPNKYPRGKNKPRLMPL